jgi:diacylglycerol kinase family enzyme
MKRVALIVNPFASGVSEAGADAVAEELSRAGSLTTLPTQAAGHATELARETSGRFDAVVVYSGDGGFNEAVNGLDGGTPVGFIPGGGTSVLPRALGLPLDPRSAARRLADAVERGRTRRISLGRVNGRRFAFTAGVGLDAELVRRVDARGRAGDGRRPGDLYFAWTAARFLLERRVRFDPALEIHGLGRAAFALVSNGDPYTYLGRIPLHVAPEARFELGLDLVAPVSVRARSLPRLLVYALGGRGQARAHDILYGHDLDRIEIACDAAMPLQADGEDLGDADRVVLACERDAISVLL